MSDTTQTTATEPERLALSKCVASLDAVEPRKEYKTEGNPTRGKCYLASIALLQYLGGVKSGYHLVKASEPDIGDHYWVETPAGAILDATVEQFQIMGRSPPYPLGKRVGFQPNVKKHLPILERMR